eukprot:gene17524-17724_t
MQSKRYAFIKAKWHADIVDRALEGFLDIIPGSQIDVFDVPGALEMPLTARNLALTGNYVAVVAAALVVDGGIYRHDFVAQAVVDGLMRVGLDTGVPILSVSLTPHNYQETAAHIEFFRAHFVEKGREAAHAAKLISDVQAEIKAMTVEKTITPQNGNAVDTHADSEASSQFFRELRRALGADIWIVVVDDGSVRQPVQARLITDAGLNGVVLRLKRNWGHQRAIAVGLGYVAEQMPDATCVVMDSDGEDLPSTIRHLLLCLDDENTDVAVAQRKSRVETIKFKAFYVIYKVLFKVLTGRQISFGNFMAAKPAAVQRLADMQEIGTHIAATVLISKLRIAVCPLDRGPRYAGQSKMNFSGLVLHGFRALMIFAEDVLVRAGLAFIGIATASLITIGLTIGLKSFGLATPGWFSIALGILLLVLLQTSALTLMTLMLTGVVRGGSPVAPDYKLLVRERSQPIRYLINGLFATAIHYGCLTIELSQFGVRSAGLANFFAAILGIATSFLGSRYFVFREFSETLMNQIARFAIVYGVLACIHAVLLFAWTDMIGLNYSIGFMIGICVQVVASYFGNKYLVFRGIYLAHIHWLQINVIFYAAIADGLLAAGGTGALALLLRRRLTLTGFELTLLVLIWCIGGYAVAISGPTVLDRSLSLYILEKLQQRGGGIAESAISRVFTEEYLPEFRLVDVRLTEQMQSGTIEIINGCVRLTEKGRHLAAISHALRQNFLAKHRLLAGVYTDALVDPFKTSKQGPQGYECQ